MTSTCAPDDPNQSLQDLIEDGDRRRLPGDRSSASSLEAAADAKEAAEAADADAKDEAAEEEKDEL